MSEQTNFYWGNLLHLGCNMWTENGNTRGREHRSNSNAFTELHFHRELWDRHIQELKDAGCNMLIIDVGEALLYESHPELAVKGSWTHEEMRKEIKKLQGMGFEVVPKLNFSASHDIWLKEYSWMLSTSIYYQVCKDVIDEVCQVFKPKFFHLGMDEETAEHQRNFDHITVRQHDLWWKDFYYLMGCVEKHNARPWIWSDYIWNHPLEFLKKMPREVLQSNWYYSGAFADLSERQQIYVNSFDILNQNGYEQIPTGSVWADFSNFEKLTRYSAEHIAPDRLLGMMQTTWERITHPYMPLHSAAATTLAAAKKWMETKKK